MPFTFRMVLSGLMVVVPDRPRFLLAPVESLTVLLPNLQRPQEVGNNGSSDILDPHFPFLEIPAGSRVATSSRAIDLEVPTRGASLFHLAGEEISIRVPGLSSALSINTLQPIDPANPTAAEQRSLFWLATVEQASPGYGVVDADLLSADLAGHESITTRLRIDTGRFCTHLLSSERCRFEPVQAGEVERHYAIRLALEIEGVPTEVILDLARGGASRELRLAPPAGASLLEVHLTNREFEDIVHPPQNPSLPLPARPTRPLADFHVFYGFSDKTRNNGGAPAVRRHLQMIPPPNSNPAIGPVNPPHALCPPTGMTTT